MEVVECFKLSSAARPGAGNWAGDADADASTRSRRSIARSCWLRGRPDGREAPAQEEISRFQDLTTEVDWTSIAVDDPPRSSQLGSKLRVTRREVSATQSPHAFCKPSLDQGLSLFARDFSAQLRALASHDSM